MEVSTTRGGREEASTTIGGREDPEGIRVLDGSVLEGGGQILRNSVAYSALLRKKLRIVCIRAGRSPPGLRMQHLKGIQLVQELCGGELEGGEVSSTALSFLPRELQLAGTSRFVDIQTAGSITLLIQTVLPVLLFQPWSQAATDFTKPSIVTLVGGTNATQAPQIDYFIHVFLPTAKRMFGEGRVQARVERRGYYPKGQGEVQLEVTPLAPGEALKAIDLRERGKVTRICGYIFVGGVLPVKMAWQMHKQALHDLEMAGFGEDNFPSLEHDLQVVKEHEAVGGGSGLVLWAETEGGCVIAGSAIGDRNKKTTSVATQATAELLQNLAAGACVDEYLQDHLVILMALAKGTSRIITGPITLHSQTAMWVATELTGVAFESQQLDNGLWLVECHGIGLASAAKASLT